MDNIFYLLAMCFKKGVLATQRQRMGKEDYNFISIVKKERTKSNSVSVPTNSEWLPILEHMRTDWMQEIVELGREIKLTGFVLPVQMVELYHDHL